MALSTTRFGDNEYALVNNLVDAFLGHPRRECRRFTPRLDVYTNEDNNMEVVVDLPGLTADDVKVTVSNGRLTISGERNREYTSSRISERYHGAFSRSIAVPRYTRQQDVTGDFVNGVLRLTIARNTESPPDTFEVSL